ncbi:hypothetical protein CDEST_01439 [Colletotrichum destructivum]|uniref:Uncharacterized protein n=1 Tax=Colletotrichum destructivum TaxID=34406 RepID=A0AAX4I0A7_9PEZI|nr:hypothetical protein CDEST_01439 [Colletotrichum destructivum]
MDSPLPEVISMESSARSDSCFRVRCGSPVKYIVTTQGTLHGDALLMPLFSLPPLPYSRDDWTVATISRSNETGELVPSLSNGTLLGVKEIWHPEMVDCLSLDRVERLSATAFECIRRRQQTGTVTTIAKVARFEWEIPRMERVRTACSKERALRRGSSVMFKSKGGQ